MSRFPGAKSFCLIWLLTGVAWAEDGQAAFDRKDFAAAASLWRDEAADGSADAMLGLGLVHDLGLGVARDPATALRWYLEAAAFGLADAQFNAGVMLDSGVGVGREPSAAALWYSRSAANGNPRAQYNLGVLYATGAGVPVNPDLARYWLTKAAPTIAAARERLESLPDGERGMTAPVPLGGSIVLGDAGRAELAWTAAPGSEGSTFQVQVVAGSTPLPIVATEASAVSVEVAGAGDVFWRVMRVDGGDYAASGWQSLGAASNAPLGSVVLSVAKDDPLARDLADDLVRSFRPAGLATIVVEQAGGDESSVTYAYPADADLAEQIADFLPGLTMRDAVRKEGTGAPGQIAVRLVSAR